MSLRPGFRDPGQFHFSASTRAALSPMSWRPNLDTEFLRQLFNRDFTFDADGKKG